MKYNFNGKQILNIINILAGLYSLCKSVCKRKILFFKCTSKEGRNVTVFINTEEQERLVRFSLIPISN